jgi:hypothetical protein
VDVEAVLITLMVVVAILAAAGWIVTLSWVLPAIGELYLGRKTARIGHQVTGR